MNRVLLLLCVFSCIYANAQKGKPGERIYYFITKDSLIGVKNEFGTVLIKPRKVYYDFEDDFTKPITDKLIYLDAGLTDSIEPHSCMVVYNRKGEFLFAPFMFDNGPDGYSEGLMRFVKNGKVGFVNRNGDVVIEAKYDYAEMFNYGLTTYCNGCTWKHKGEHAFVTGGTWGYLNYKGDTIAVMNNKMNEKDQELDSAKFLPYQFSYSKFEQKIIDSFNKLTIISKACFAGYSSPLDSSERLLRYEIVERPSSFFPYYYVAAFSYSKGEGYQGNPFGGLNFCVDRTGNNFFYIDANEKIPLRIWLKKYIKEAKAYLLKYPESLNKF